jgi:uncharacterized membrane protein YkoI
MKGKKIAVFMVCISLLVGFGMAAASFENTIANEDPASDKPSLYLDPSKEKGIISCDNAQAIIANEFPGSEFVAMEGGLIEDEIFGKIWLFSASTKDGDHILIGIDASSGDVDFYYGNDEHTITREETTSSTEAIAIAQKYLSVKASDANVQFDSIRYSPPPAETIAGEYLVRYSRLIYGVPCLSDGISVGINPNTGDVTSYYRSEVIPVESCNDPVPKVLCADAERIASQFMKTSYKAEINIISSELIWIDLAYPSSEDGSHDVRLAWWLRFSDGYLEENNAPCSGSIWIDAHSGEILKKAYFVG